MAAATSRMTPGTARAIPFSTGVALPVQAIDKINAGLKLLQNNYGLAGKLRLAITWSENAWLFEMYHADVVKPLVVIRNKDIGAMNRFLTDCGRTIAKNYTPEATAKQRRTA